MSEFFLGIDGGGTRTQAVIVDERGQICGIGYGGSANFDAIGIDATQTNLHQAIAQAVAQAQVPDFSFRSAFLGIAGVVSASDHAIIRQISARLGIGSLLGIDHDCRIALAGGLDRACGNRADCGDRFCLFWCQCGKQAVVLLST